jgi:putative phosphotransacetylase
MKATIEISARHIHLDSDDLFTLFNVNTLPVRNQLSQKGEFASEFTVEVVGPKNRLKKVRVLGPLRKYTQLEISRTDSFFLGLDAPLAHSGEGIGEAVRVIGQKGEITKKIAMVAKRHFHCSTEFAKRHHLKSGMYVGMHIPGERSLILEKIFVRVADHFADTVHIDTDEANAADIHGISYGTLIRS